MQFEKKIEKNFFFFIFFFNLLFTHVGYVIFKKSTFALAVQEDELVVAFGNLSPGWKW